MKQKIKIMDHKQQPSDEEIRGYMDFDRVLENRNIALHPSRLSTIFKWSVPVCGTLVIIAFYEPKQPPKQCSRWNKNQLSPRKVLHHITSRLCQDFRKDHKSC